MARKRVAASASTSNSINKIFSIPIGILFFICETEKDGIAAGVCQRASCAAQEMRLKAAIAVSVRLVKMKSSSLTPCVSINCVLLIVFMSQLRVIPCLI